MKVAAIVEGDGEVAALSVLLRRIGEWRTSGHFIHVMTPIRVRRDQFLNRDKEFSRHLFLAAGKCGEGGWILILLDADDEAFETALSQVSSQLLRHIADRVSTYDGQAGQPSALQLHFDH